MSKNSCIFAERLRQMTTSKIIKILTKYMDELNDPVVITITDYYNGNKVRTEIRVSDIINANPTSISSIYDFVKDENFSQELTEPFSMRELIKALDNDKALRISGVYKDSLAKYQGSKEERERMRKETARAFEQYCAATGTPLY